MEINKIYKESCLDTLKKMPNDFIDCVITSPPYWQLRDYGYNEQWGLEKTFNEYLANLWSMMNEIHRVLKQNGTCWINLGDSYSTQSGTNLAKSKGKEYINKSTYLTNRGESANLIKDKSLPNKCLLMLPHRFAIGYIDIGFIVRNDIIWAKRNGMPESVSDRFSKKHEYMFFMVKNEKYYFNLDLVRDKHKDISLQRINKPFKSNHASIGEINVTKMGDRFCNPLGKNPGSVSDFWDINTKPSNDSHYAQYNDELIMKPLLAGCPINGIVYDPFMGSGTTALACLRTNRNFIGSELSEDYYKLANDKIELYNSQLKLF